MRQLAKSGDPPVRFLLPAPRRAPREPLSEPHVRPRPVGIHMLHGHHVPGPLTQQLELWGSGGGLPSLPRP